MLKRLVSFDVAFKHNFSTSECKNINNAYAVIVFKIAELDGSISNKSLEVTLDELNHLRAELTRIEESLS